MLTPLDFMGWKKAEEQFISLLNQPENDKTVLLFPHTSTWDTVMALFYILWDKNVHDFRNRFRFIVWDESYYRPVYNTVYKYLGGIPVPHFSKKGNGSMDRIYEELDQMEKFVLLISPKGSCGKVEWRSGWYHIAKRYDASVLVAGPDFEQHTMVVSGEAEKIQGRSYTEMESAIKPKFSQIVPLEPEKEVVPIRDHNSTSVVDWSGVAVVLIILIILILVVFLTALKPNWCYSGYDNFKGCFTLKNGYNSVT